MNEHAKGDVGKSGPSPYSAHDVLGYLLDHGKEMSRSHAKIAESILAHPTTFVEKPIEDLVTWIGVSAPTITRFARAIGCDGLRDLKLNIMSSMPVGARYLEPVTPPGTLEEVIDHVILRARRTMLGAQRTMNVAGLEQAIDLLARSRMIYAFGSGGVSSWLIEEVQNRLFLLGLRITTSNDHQMQMMLAAAVERDDIVFCFSLSGNIWNSSRRRGSRPIMERPRSGSRSLPNGKIAGLAYYAGHDAFIYNEEHLSKAGVQQPPDSWDSLLDACPKLKKDGISDAPFNSAWGQNWPELSWNIFSCWYAERAPVFSATFDLAPDEAFTKVLETFRTLYKEQLVAADIMTLPERASRVTPPVGTRS